MPTQIEIGGRTYAATLPASYTQRMEIAMLMGVNALRAAAAVLGLSVPGLVKVTLSACRYDVGLYSGRVLDRLHADAGLEAVDVLEAAAPLLEELGELLAPSESEVGAAEDFTEGEAGQTSSP